MRRRLDGIVATVSNAVSDIGVTSAGAKGADKSDPGNSRVLTVPNVISFARLACLPLFCWLLFARNDRQPAAGLLVLLGVSDWVDGKIARRFNQVSELGKVLDPAADRLLVGTVVISMLIDESLPAALGLVIVAREVVVSVATIGLAVAGARRIDVQWVGKAGTFLLMTALPLFLLGESDPPWWGTQTIAWIVALPGALLSYYAAFTYVPIARDALAEGRAARKMGVFG